MIALVANQILYPEIILRSTISITTNLITSISYLNSISKGDKEIQSLLSTKDILADIDVIKCFLQEIETHPDSKTISFCIKNLSDTLQELENNISSIVRKIQINKQLWFSYFRSYNIHEEKKQIHILVDKMNHRFNLLIKMSNVINKKYN